jgi:hypothetical protein
MDQADLAAIRAHPAGVDADAALIAADAAMASDNRNLRVAALRVLQGLATRSDAASTVSARTSILLMGLNDSSRRVRAEAAKLAPAYLASPTIAQRLLDIACDIREKRKIRSSAIFALTGNRIPHRRLVSVLRGMLEHQRDRGIATIALLRAEACPAVSNLLRSVIARGDRREAVLATRAMSGDRLASVMEMNEDERASLSPADRAMQALTWWWVRRV